MPKLYHNGTDWQLPGQQDTGAVRVDVPHSPAEAAAWLNARAVSPGAPGDQLALPTGDQGNPALEASGRRALEAHHRRELEEATRQAKRATEAMQRGAVEDLEQWIFDQATTDQVERIFAALGARFHEMRSN